MSLNQLLSQPDISVPELFIQPDILNQIKYKIPTFVDFCKQNQDFTKIMITMGIKTPMHNNENIDMRKVAHVASDILTCDNDALAELFIIQEVPSRIRCYSQSQDQVIEQIVSNQTTGELVIADRTPSKQNKQIDEFSRKYAFLLDLLSYIQQKQPDQNCINYMIKVLNTIIRVKPQQLFQFFIQKPEILKRLIQLTNYPSVSYSIVKLLNESQDKKYRGFKIEVINMMIKQIIGKISTNNFQVYSQFIEQVFDKNRHRSEEQDQIKVITQPLVDKQVIKIMMAGVLQGKSSLQISNSLLYLLKVAQRMNVDQQQDPYSYNTQNQNKPTMDFQVDEIYANFDKLIDLSVQINREKYQSRQILTYYDFILAMTNNSRFKNVKIKKYRALLNLLKALNKNENQFNGIIKNKIISLIQKFHNLEQSTQLQQAKQNSNSENKGYKEEIKKQVDKLNQNNKQGICYRQKLKLLLVDNQQIQKDQNIIEIYNKYSSLLASTAYTENRNLKIKQFEFLKQNKEKIINIIAKQKQKIKAQINQGNESKQNNKQQVNNESITQQFVIDHQNKKKLGTNINGFNVDMLNNKINAIKSKKQQQKVQQQNNKKNNVQNEQKYHSNGNTITQQQQNHNVTNQNLITTQNKSSQAQLQKQTSKKNDSSEKVKQKQKQKSKAKQSQEKQKQKSTKINSNIKCGNEQLNHVNNLKENKQQKLVPYYVKYLILF